MSPATSPGEDVLARLLERSPITMIDNRCFCRSSSAPHAKGVPLDCEHFELAPVKFTIPDVTP